MNLLAVLINLPEPFWCIWLLTVIWLMSAFSLGFSIASARARDRQRHAACAAYAAYLAGVKSEREANHHVREGREIA